MILAIITVLLIMSYSIVPTFYYKFKGTPIVNKVKENKFLSLTFDDGPDENYTNNLLDLLKKYDIKATFFVVAKFAEKNPKVIKRMEEEGHTIGLHSLEHKNGLLNGPIYTNKEFEESLKIMKNLNVNVKSFRPPWGHLNLTTIYNLKKYNLKLVLWDVIIGDWKANITSDEITKRLIEQSKNRSIICLHDGRGENEAPRRTIQALEKAIPIWVEEGYKFLKVGELYE